MNWNFIATIVLIVLAVVAAVLGALYYFGSKAQASQAESQKLIEQYSQVITLLVIDKKKFRLKDAPVPDELYSQTPFYLKPFVKIGVVKAKVGPKVLNLVADDKVFELLPLKAECKCKISGMYITDILKGAYIDEKEMKRRVKANEKAEKKAQKEAAKKDRK